MHFLYRKRSGEVVGASTTTPPPWPETDTFGVVSDAHVSDGNDLQPPKIYDGSAMRLATPAEMVTFEAAKAADELGESRSGAKSFLDKRAGFPLRAALVVLVKEINVLRALNSLPPLTKAELRRKYRDEIDAGGAD